MPQVAKIKVFVVDDHEAINDMLTDSLNKEPDMECTGRAKTRKEALYRLQFTAVDILLLDVRIDGAENLDLFQKIHTTFPVIKIIAFTGIDKYEFSQKAKQLGARGYIPKSKGKRIVLQAIRDVYKGQTAFLVDRSKSDENEKIKALLTQKEKEVVYYLTEGYCYKQIGKVMAISPETAETHKKNIKKKLSPYMEVNDARIGRWAIESKLFEEVQNSLGVA